MAISNLLNSDLLLLQRPSVVPASGRSSGELFKVSLHSISEYVEEQFDTDIVTLKEDFEFLNQRVDFIENQLITSLNSTLTDQHYQIVVLEDRTEELIVVTEDLQEQIDAALAKAKINFYYQLVDNVSPASGQMTVLNEDNEVAASLDEVTKLVYNIRDSNDVVERFANVYKGEIVEVTALNNVKSALTHRGIYTIDNITFGFDLFTFDVTVRNASGEGIPFFQSAFGNLVRSDLYPVFTMSEDEIDEKISKYLPLTGGTITGEFTLKKDLQLAKSAAGIVKYNNTFKLVDNDGDEPFEISEGSIQMRRNLLMNNKTITGLATTTATDSAATVGYVNSRISSEVVTEADLFKVGDPVAASSEAGTSARGFFFNGGSLYFKV